MMLNIGLGTINLVLAILFTYGYARGARSWPTVTVITVNAIAATLQAAVVYAKATGQL